jgi:hypothetical protein
MWLKWIVLFLFTSSAWAFKFTSDFTNGFYWSTLPIAIDVVEKDPARKSMLESLAQAAIDDWQTSSGLSLWNFLGTGSKNIIRWSTNFAGETRMDPQSVLAVAIRYTDGPYFARTEIVINGGHELNQNQTYLRTTITHELGHTMGLDHSDVSEAVMAPTLQPWYTGLHQDDLDGMHAAYAEMDHRQIIKYVSPLAYGKEKSQSQPLSCGTVGPLSSASSYSFSGLLSLASGILISFVRKISNWFKSRL